MRRSSLLRSSLMLGLITGVGASPALADAADKPKPRLPVGEYVRDVPATAANIERVIAGQWRLIITRKTYELILEEPGAEVLEAPPQPIRQRKNRLTFLDPQPRSDDKCRRGTYRFKLGKGLRFALVKDACANRRIVLRGRWQPD